jgi:hypothetical protein
MLVPEEGPEPSRAEESNGRATAAQRRCRNLPRMTSPIMHKPNAEDPHHA